MREKIRLQRKGEAEASELWFEDGIEVPKVCLEAPVTCSIFQSEVERQFLKDHPDKVAKTNSAEKVGIHESEILSKSGKCGLCKCTFATYSEHVESPSHVSSYQSLHEAYARLDSLLQEYRKPPEKLAPIFLPAVRKRKPEFPSLPFLTKSPKLERKS